MRLIHIFLKPSSKRPGEMRWGYRSMGRTPVGMLTKAGWYCHQRNKSEGRC